jgi:hypothetical protein
VLGGRAVSLYLNRESRAGGAGRLGPRRTWFASRGQVGGRGRLGVGGPGCVGRDPASAACLWPTGLWACGRRGSSGSGGQSQTRCGEGDASRSRGPWRTWGTKEGIPSVLIRRLASR